MFVKDKVKNSCGDEDLFTYLGGEFDVRGNWLIVHDAQSTNVLERVNQY